MISDREGSTSERKESCLEEEFKPLRFQIRILEGSCRGGEEASYAPSMLVDEGSPVIRKGSGALGR